MADFIVFVILAAIVGAAVFYIYKSKKNGVKCIGCPAGCKCSSQGKHAEETSCGCGCGGSGCDCNCHAEME